MGALLCASLAMADAPHHARAVDFLAAQDGTSKARAELDAFKKSVDTSRFVSFTVPDPAAAKNLGRVSINPNPPQRARSLTITYDAAGGPLAGASQVYIHRAKNNWSTIVSPDPAMTPGTGSTWTHTFVVDADANQIEFVFNNGAGTWDNNSGQDWKITTIEPPTDDPLILLDKSSIARVVLVGADASPASFTVSNAGGGQLDFTATTSLASTFPRATVIQQILNPAGGTPADNNADSVVDAADIVAAMLAPQGWLQVSPPSGSVTTTPATVTVTFATAALAAGHYTAQIHVAGNATNSPRSIDVSLHVLTSLPTSTTVDPNPPIAAQSAVVWYRQTDGPLAAASTINLHWGINGGLSAGGTWQQVTSTPMTSAGSGMWFAPIQIPETATSLNFVTNDGAGNWDSNGGQDWNFPVQAFAGPVLALSRSSIVLTTPEGSNPPSETFTVRNAGQDTLDYTLAKVGTGSGTSWFNVTPLSGSSTGEADTITVSFATSGLAPGSYSARIDVAGNAVNSPQSVHVGVTVTGTTPSRPITIGQGRLLGTDTNGQAFYEEFQDWTAGDLRALDLPDDAADLGDSYKWSRDIVAFYSRFEDDNLYFRIDLLELGIFAEQGFVDAYVLIDCASGGSTALPNGISGSTSRQWNLAVAAYDAVNNAVIAANGSLIQGAHLGSYWRSDLDAVEFGVRQSALRDAGWDGTSVVHFNVFTAKDMTSTVADAIDLGSSIPSNSTTGRAKFATIAHGNQSLNRGDGMRDRIYIPAASTGVGAPSGFRLTLDTHMLFQIPLNIHMSATLISAIAWIEDPNPLRDGSTFLELVARVIDANQAQDPGSKIGGVFSEHIMPFFVGQVNLNSIMHFDDLTRKLWGIDGGDMKVMHIPERVANSRAAPARDLFDDIVESDYIASYLDEVAHIRDWFYPSDPWTGIGGVYGEPRHHKIHRINGVYNFLINDMEDQYKFWPQDNGANLNWRFNLLYKAMDSDQSQLTLIFDDWEALAGYSFGSGYNNNALQYQQVMRWVANKPWIEVVNLADILDRAINPANPRYAANWIIDQGTVGNKPFNTYDYLHHATENSYENWYYGSALEESFSNAVPVLDGVVGNGTPIPSGKRFGELGVGGTIIHDTWQAVLAAPAGPLRSLAELAYSAMIYETAWHDEDNTNYERDPATNHHTWKFPDTTYDRVSGWAFTLHNHLRGVTITTTAAAWAARVAAGTEPPTPVAEALDLDQDGQDEYVLRNNRVWMAFERRGGRCVQAYYHDATLGRAISFLGTSPINNPSAQGEEERTTTASRCSGFKEMNDDLYADALYTATVGSGQLTFVSPNGQVSKTISLASGSGVVTAQYMNSTGSDLYVRFGVGVNNLDLLHAGRNFISTYGATSFTQTNKTGGSVTIAGQSNASINALDDFTRHIIPLTEQMEVRLGSGASTFTLTVP
jgi:hypothetical protein